MGSASATCEIEEVIDDLDLTDHSRRLNPIKVKRKGKEVSGKYIFPTSARCSMEEELNQLIESIDRKSKGPRSSHPMATLNKNFQKKPIGVGMSRSPGIGISEGVTLKQALRGLCISQASEMAAMKRLSKSGASSRNSEAGTIKRLYRAVIVENNMPGPVSCRGDKCSLVEVSLIGNRNTTEEVTNSLLVRDVEQSGKNAAMSALLTVESVDLPPADHSGKSSNASHQPADKLISGGLEMEKSSLIRDASSSATKVCNLSDTLSTTEGAPDSLLPSVRGSNTCYSSRKSPASSRTIQSNFKNTDYVKKKMSQKLESASTRASSCTGADQKASSCGMHKSHKIHIIEMHARNESASPINSLGSPQTEMTSGDVVIAADAKPVGNLRSPEPVEKSNQTEKIEYSHSSMSSLGDCSSSTSISDESSSSGPCSTCTRPHMSKNLRWEAIHQIETQHGDLGLSNFKLVKRLGCGDIGTVYLAQLIGTTFLFALKVMDNNFLTTKKKMPRVQTERSILKMLDHPFLPTLYAHFTTEKLSCLAMEYCPGGDLHVLRQKQPGRHFSEQAVRFYAAEVLLALEYLHMLGIIYRDLKPENILVREDGHIMLSDFDLSLRCSVHPTLLKPSSPPREPVRREHGVCFQSPCIDPLCLQPSWSQISCFTPRLPTAAKTRRLKSDPAAGQVISLPQLVAEPNDARSNSFVGTHEYLAPEIIKGDGHGSCVDWWTYGIFIFELMFGITPFKGSGNDETLDNVVSESLKFPECPSISQPAKDLIKGLLMKEPESRLGFMKGATEIKQHPFFEGLNWALIRCAVPPEIPKMHGHGSLAPWHMQENKSFTVKSMGDHLKFEVF